MTSDAAVAEFTHVEKKVYSHGKLVNAWKKDHEQARAETFRERLVAIHFESMIKDTFSIWDELEQIKTVWTDGVMSGEFSSDIGIDKRLYSMSRRWQETAGQLVSVIDRAAHFKITFAGSVDLRELLLEVSETLEYITEPTTPIRPLPMSLAAMPKCEFDTSRYDDV